MNMKGGFKVNEIVRRPIKDRVDVLLIYPIWVTAFGRGKLQRMLPPLGILSIASYLKAHGFEVQILDMHAEGTSVEKFREILKALKPRFVGITVLSSHFRAAHRIASLSREEVPDARVIVGGTHAELYPEVMLKNPAIEGVCRGDGEEVMLQFVQDRPLESILGLSFRKNQREVQNNAAQTVEMNLDKYPLPAYELIDFYNYFPAVGTYKTLPGLNALATRGCPGKCTFCNSAKTILRGRSVESMVELMQMLRDDYGIKQVTFYDDTFTANPRFVRSFCDELIAKKVDINWVCYVRGDMFSEEMASLMARAGCHHVLVGIESGSESLMKDIGKHIEKERYIEMVERAHRHGMEVRGAFIVGHINETHASLEETLQFAMEMDVDFFQPSVLTPYPGTALYQMARAENLLLHEDYERYGQGEVILKMKNLETKDIERYMFVSFLRFYFRPISIWRQIKRLNNKAQLMDIFKSFYIIFLERFKKGKENNIQDWHSFDLEKTLSLPVFVPDEHKLTYEVKQKEA